MEDSFNSGCLSFFTANHGRHDEQWLQKGSHLTLACFACFVEIIENKYEPSIRKSRILQELLNLISAGDILQPLAANESVVSHLLTCLWEVMEFHNVDNTSSQNITVIEIIYQLCCSLKCEALVGKVMEYLTQKLVAAENIKKVSPQLDLLGKLLQKIPGLTKNVVEHRQNLLAYITKASAFPDEGIRSSLFFILTHLYRDKDCCQTIPVSTTEIVFRECCQVLTSATSKELQINSIALLQTLTRPENLPKGSQTITSHIERVTTSLKKAFLSREDLVKSLAIACLDNLVLYDERMIDSDLTGFLFEVFKTKNESLLALGFQCVSQLVEKKALYTKGHVLYGFETIVSAVMMANENRNSKLVRQGFGVLAKVLGNCPAEVSLISSKKVLLQCLDVIRSGLCSLDDAVFLQACSCFSCFLESRHFACDVPYGRLMALIEPLAERLRKVCKGTGHWDQAANKDLQSSTIDAILEVFKKSLDLALCGQNEPPTLEALLVSQEDNTRKEFEQFVNKLLQLCDQICIPNVISDFKKLYGTAVPEKFFEILNKFLLMCPMESMKEMSEKFVSSSFIRIALDTKAYYFGKSSSNGLQSSVNRFLEIICCRLSSPDMQQNLKSVFSSRLQNVNGSTQELLQVLKQNNAGDEALKETQECIVVLFWLAYLHGDRLVTTSQLLHALSNFLVLNPACYDRSVIIPRCLTQLYITELHRHDNRTTSSPLLQRAMHILADSITKYAGNVDMVYFHDIVFVEWAMEAQELNPILRKEVLRLWFSHTEENDLSEREIDLWKGLVERSPNTLIFLASILGTGEEHAQNKILCILHHVLQACPVESQAVENTVRELKITLQKLFLNQALDPLPDKNMKSVLKLLCLLVTFSPKGPLDDDFMKLVYHVVNLIKRPGINTHELSTERLNFLNASMVHEGNCGSHQVLRFLLKHHDYNRFLESVIDSIGNAMDVETSPSTLAAVLISISHLARFQRIFAINTDDELEVDLEVVMSLLCHTTRPLLQFAANLFWTSILQSDESNAYVSLTTKVSRNTGNSEQKLNKIHLRVILVRLQNSLLHGNPLVQLSALRCLESLLSRAKDVKDLLQDPWNRVMLREVVASSDDLTLISLQLYSLFLYNERTKATSLEVPVKDLLQVALRHFSEFEITSNPYSVKWLLGYARFFRDVIQRKSDELTALEKSNLRCHVQHLIDSYPEVEVSMDENGEHLVYLQGVLIHDELIQEKRNHPKQALKELFDLLK